MNNHTRIYLDYFNYGEEDFISCECCGARARDVYHINARGMGGDPQGKKDVISNLMAVCRECHIKYGDKKQYKEFLQEVHDKFIENYER